MKGPSNTMENSCTQELGSLAQKEQPTNEYGNSYGISNYNSNDANVCQMTEQVN